MVCLMVLPAVLDGAPRRRIAARQGSRPPDRVHSTRASGPAAPGSRVLPAKGSTGTHDLLNVPKVPTAANFGELRLGEVRRIPLLRRWVNKGKEKGQSCYVTGPRSRDVALAARRGDGG